MHVSPNIQMKGDVRFDLQLPIVCHLKNSLITRAFPMLHQLTVQKPEPYRKNKTLFNTDLSYSTCRAIGENLYIYISIYMLLTSLPHF